METDFRKVRSELDANGRKFSPKSSTLLTEKESPISNFKPEDSSMPTVEVRLALVNNGENSRRKLYRNY